MAGMLTPEQMSQFTQELQAQEGDPAPVEEPQAPQEPQEDPQADPAAPGVDAPPVDGVPPEPVAPPQEVADPNVEILANLGFGSVGDLAQAFQDTSTSLAQIQEDLTRLMQFNQALGNEDELDPNDPSYALRSAVRSEFSPLLDPVREDIRNRMVQRAWGASAAEMPDLEDHKADIMEYFKEHGELSVADDGLRRAYDAVRSRKYRPEADLLSDPEFRKRAMENPDLKQAIIQAHLAQVAKNGDVPSPIGEGGGAPLTGKKVAVNSMDDAKKGLLSMLTKASK